MKANLMQAEETSPPPPSSAPSGAQLNNTQAAAAIVSSPHSADAAATAAAVTAAMNAGQNFLMAAAAAAAASTGGGGREGPMGVPGVAPGTIDLALQQRLQQQFIHRQILEHQMHQQRNLQQFAVEERQLSVLLQQVNNNIKCASKLLLQIRSRISISSSSAASHRVLLVHLPHRPLRRLIYF